MIIYLWEFLQFVTKFHAATVYLEPIKFLIISHSDIYKGYLMYSYIYL